MTRILLLALSWLILCQALVAAPLEDYQFRLQTAVETLQSGNTIGRENALETLIWLIPAEEEVTTAAQTIKVNNGWVHELVSAFVQEPDATKRNAIYQGLQERLRSLSEQVNQTRPATLQNTQSVRRQLDAILSQRAFQRYRDESWMTRIRKWMRENLNRLWNLLPQWRRGDSPLSRFLEVIVWILASIVLILTIRALIRRFQNSPVPKPAPSGMIMGVVIDQRASPNDLREKALSLAQQGAYREAIRYLYISLLYELHERDLIELHAGTTNGEVLQRLRSDGQLYAVLRLLTQQFNHVWYGQSSPKEADYQQFFQQYEGAVKTLAG